MNKQRGAVSPPVAWLAVAIIAVCFVGVAYISALIPQQPAAVAPRDTPPVSYTATYKVTGYHSGSLTYSNESGGTEQRSNEYLPWEKSFTARKGDHLAVSVQNSKDIGWVQCDLLVNGVVVKTSRSDGAYVIASCSGSM